MTVTTSRNKTFPIDWMWGPVGRGRELMLQLHDPRPLSQIAADFEGCEAFHRLSDEEGDMDFEGYTALRGVLRPDPEGDPQAAQLTLARPGKEETHGD